MDGIGALVKEFEHLAAGVQSALGPVCEGVVTAAGRGNLAVKVGQLPELAKEDLAVNPWYSYRWVLDEGQAEYLRAGDRVLLLTADGQNFYLEIGRAHV